MKDDVPINEKQLIIGTLLPLWPRYVMQVDEAITLSGANRYSNQKKQTA